MSIPQSEQVILRDPALYYWILFPITVVMILTGLLRHYATVLMQSDPKKVDIKTMREQRNLLRGISLRSNANHIPLSSYLARKDFLVAKYQEGAYLKDPENMGKAAPNPMTDPNGMDQMMNMVKGNMMSIVPQTLIMGWINAFFSGYVILKLPFPLTIRFKSMLQSGVATRDMDVRWVSSLSWYFLNLFGLKSVFSYLLGSENSADHMSAQMQQMNPMAGAQMFAPGQDPHKLYLGEAENLEVVAGQHEYVLDGVEERVLQKLGWKK